MKRQLDGQWSALGGIVTTHQDLWTIVEKKPHPAIALTAGTFMYIFNKYFPADNIGE